MTAVVDDTRLDVDPDEADPYSGEADPDEEAVRAQVGQLTVLPTQKKLTPLQLRAFKAICNFDPRKEPQSWPYINVWLQVCAELKLSPWSRKIYLYKRGEGHQARYVIQTSIHGLTGLAKRTGRFIKWHGTVYTSHEDTPEWWREATDPETGQVTRERVWVSSWIWPDKHPAAARTFMSYYDQHGQRQIMHADAHWHSYAPYRPKTVGEGAARRRVINPETGEFVLELPKFWSQDGGALMLGKCSRAHALRLEFPEETSAVFIDEELHREDAEAEARAQADAVVARREAYMHAQADGVNTEPGTVNAAGGSSTVNADDPAARTAVNTAATSVNPRTHADGTPVNEGVHDGREGVNDDTATPVRDDDAAVNESVNPPVRVTAEQRREWVMAEIDRVSHILGKDVSVPIVRRLARAPGVTLEDLATDDILSMVGSFRATVAERLRERGEQDDAAAYLAIPPTVAAPVHVLFGWEEPGDVEPVNETVNDSVNTAAGVSEADPAERPGDDVNACA